MAYNEAYWDSERFNLLKTLVLSRHDVLTNEESKHFKSFYTKFIGKYRKNKTEEAFKKQKLIIQTLPFHVHLPATEEIFKQTSIMQLKFYITREDIDNFKLIYRFYLNFLQKQNIKKFQCDLPIAAYKDQIIYLLKTHPVIIIAGDTGCGKSTQVPQFLLHAGYKSLCCTQPRRIACISLAKRVSYETLNEFGHDVAYQVRFDTNKIENTKILFLTEGLLLRQFQVDPQLSQYSVIIVDEVHERHLNSDFLLGILRCLIKQRNDLKIILMSATINANLFSSYFNGAPLIQVPGRLHPILLEYIPDFTKKDIIIKESSNKFDPTPYVRLLQMIDQKYPVKEGGDLLIFLNGVKEINQVVDAGIKYSENNKHWLVLPLHSNLSLEQQDKVFDYAPEGYRKCIVSTNIAETSLTIDGIRFVCDSGKVNEMVYDPAIKLRKLVEMWISKSSAEQRKGRAGRTGPGICFRMYSEDDFCDFDEFPTPEIKRADLNSLVLQMMSLGLNDPISFPFIEQPESTGINCAIKDLQLRKALDKNQNITFFGRTLAALPLDPSVAAVLIYCCFLDMLIPSLIYVSALGVQTAFTQSFNGRCDFRDKYLGDVSENFINGSEGDPFMLLKAFLKWLDLKRSDQFKHSKHWCRKVGIIERRFYDMVQLCNQFKRLLQSLRLSSKKIGTDKVKLSKAEEEDLKQRKQDLLNAPRKRKFLNADFNLVEDDLDIGELDVKEIEFRLGRSGSFLSELSTESFTKNDTILFTLGIALGLYPQFSIPDDSNEFRKDSEQFFHTKDKQFLSLHPNSLFGMYPENLKTKLSVGRQPWMLVYVGLLETIKPYLLNSTKIAAIPVLLLSCDLDTDSNCSRIVADGWLEMRFNQPHDALTLLCLAISIRSSFSNLIELYFSSELTEIEEQKLELLDKLYDDITDFFKRDIDCTLKYIVNADRQIMYRRSTSIYSNVPADLLIMIEDKNSEPTPHPKKGGCILTPYLTFGCLVDIHRETIDQPYLQTHFTCPNCNIHLICTPNEQINHLNICQPPQPEPIKEIKKTDQEYSNIDPNKIQFLCDICKEQLILTKTEILRHKLSHRSS